MKKQIFVDGETRVFLQKTFKCTGKHVWSALTFRSDSDTARRIRVLALKRGGTLAEGYIPKCETTHNTIQGTMVQTFGTRVRIAASRKTGEVTVEVDGKMKDKYNNLSIAEFMQLQYEMEQLAAAL